MIKAAKFTLGLLAVVSITHAVFAQTDPAAEAAIIESVKRQNAAQTLQLKVEEARVAIRAKNIDRAVKLLEEAVSNIPQIGIGDPTVEGDKRSAVDMLVNLRIQLAKEDALRADYAAADVELSRALKIDPTNAVAAKFKAENDRILAASLGTVPSPDVLGMLPDFARQNVDINTKLQNGKLLFEAGKLDNAELRFKEVVAADPENKTAFHYLKLINERRFAENAEMRDTVTGKKIVAVEKAWMTDEQRDVLPVPNPYARSTDLRTSAGRNSIYQKLDKIRLNEVNYDNLPLGEVLKQLSDESTRRDPEGKGLNFMLNNHVDSTASATLVDATGAPVAPPAPVDLQAITVRLSRLKDVSLAQVLDAIVKVADQPITFTVEDYAVMFRPKSQDNGPTLYTKQIKVDPDTFLQGLESVVGLSFSIQSGTTGGGGGGSSSGSSSGDPSFAVPRVLISPVQAAGGSSQGGGQSQTQAGVGGAGGVGITGVTKTNNTANFHALVNAYFTAAGVNLAPPKAVFFNHRAGLLLIRATLEDIEIIQQAIDTLNRTPGQITIEAKFAELSQTDSRALGFDWFLGNMLLNNKSIGAQGGTAPSFNGTPSIANPSGNFPGPGIVTAAGVIPGAGAIPPSVSDNLLTSGLRPNIGGDSIPTVATISGILTDPQFRLAIRAMEQRSGIDVLNAPRVTTVSGVQAQITVLDQLTIVSGVAAGNTASGGTAGTAAAGGTAGTGVAATIQFTTTTFPVGPTLDVIPSIGSDGYSVHMTLIPAVTEFIGYDDPGKFVPQAQSVAGNTLGTSLTAVLPLPHFRIRQVTTSCIVWDGQTVVLGGLLSEDTQKLKDKIPMLGDLPFLGRFFRSESQNSIKKNLMIFVTPTIIDPSGNRMHIDEEFPFAKSGIGAQSGFVNP
ncbi:MAG: Type and secretion system protein [Verrucomicrobiales bacterium]|nr:Type and secretion system protein [Verrucomicrobiales bacterium]